MPTVDNIEVITVDLIDRLRTRATIRRQITTRKSVIENKPDRIADLLEEAAIDICITYCCILRGKE